MLNFRALRDQVLVQDIIDSNVRESGVFVFHNPGLDPSKAVVIAVGEGVLRSDGTLEPLEVKAGDVVLIEPMSGSLVEVDGVMYKCLPIREVLAVIEEA